MGNLAFTLMNDLALVITLFFSGIVAWCCVIWGAKITTSFLYYVHNYVDWVEYKELKKYGKSHCYH